MIFYGYPLVAGQKGCLVLNRSYSSPEEEYLWHSRRRIP